MVFPSLKGKKFGYMNLNLEAEKWLSEKGYTNQAKNPLLDPKICQEMVQDIHNKYSIDFSYGGWMEDRNVLWKGHYLAASNFFIHLGMDINVPSGTEIAIDFDAEIVKIDDDFSLEGGWGPHIFVKNLSHPVYMIFAHLDRDIMCKVGEKLKKGQVFAKVGKAPYNGNWFPHVHIQTITAEEYKRVEKGNLWREFDGYGSIQDLSKNARIFLDPLKFISLT